MSSAVTRDVLGRAMSDESFLARFRSDPEAALDEYDLEERERNALASGNESEIRELLGEAKAGITVVVVVIR